MHDMDQMDIGEILDLIVSAVNVMGEAERNGDGNTVRKGTQADIDRIFK